MKCPRCGLDVTEAGLTHIQPVECPSCGKRLTRPRPKWDTGLSVIRNYFSDVWQILTHPTLFFRHMPLTGGIAQPLAFALVTHWLGSALSFLWHLIIGGTLAKSVQSWMQMSEDIDHIGRNAQMIQARDRIIEWFFGAGPVILDPFLTLFSILATSFLVFLGARILVAPGKKGHPTEITFESAVRIVAFGLTPSILAAVPILGGFLSSLGVMIVTIIGAKEVYKIGTGRAIAVALFPKLLFFGIIGMGLLFFVLVVFKLFTSAF